MARELASARGHISSLEGQRQELVAAAGVAQERCSQLVGENRLLREQLGAREQDLSLAAQRVEAAERHAEACEGEARAMERRAREAVMEAEASADHLESLAARSVQAEERLAQGQQVLARLTADNVALVVRCRRAEEEASLLRQENHELRQQLEGQGRWYDALRSETEARVADALGQARALEELLARERAERQDDRQAWAREREGLEAAMHAAEAREASLTALLARAQEEAAAAERGAATAGEEALDARRARDLAAAESHVLQQQLEVRRLWAGNRLRRDRLRPAPSRHLLGAAR